MTGSPSIPSRRRCASARSRRVSPRPRRPRSPSSSPKASRAGPTAVRVDELPGETAFVEIGAPLVTGVHHVDSPAYDRHGNLYVTFSGSRGQQAPVSIFVVRPDGTREPFVSDVPEPDVARLRSRGTALRVEPLRRQRLPRRGGRPRVALRDRPRRRVRARVRSRRRALRRRSLRLDAARRRATAARRRSPRCRRASPRSTSRSAPTAISTSPRRRSARAIPSIASRPTARSRPGAPASAGRRGSRSTRPATYMSSTRSPARAPCTGSGSTRRTRRS